MPCGEFNARVYVEAVFFLHPLTVFHAHRQAACSVLPFQAVVHFVVYGVVVLHPASSKDDVKVLSVFFLHGSVQCQTCQFFFPCSIGIGVFSCSVVQGRADCPVSFFLVVAYLGYVIGLFEVGVLFVQFVLSAQVSGPDAVFFFGQSYVSHSSLQVVIVRPPQKDGGCHGCFGAFHHLSFFASINNRRLRLGIRIRIRIGIGIGIGIRTWVYFFCISLSTCFMEIHVRHLQRRRGCCQPFRNRRLPFQVLFSVFVGFIVQFACQGIQYIVHLLIVSHRNSAVIRHHGN